MEQLPVCRQNIGSWYRLLPRPKSGPLQTMVVKLRAVGESVVVILTPLIDNWILSGSSKKVIGKVTYSTPDY
jgi:hypothetical protein